jgi:DNA (cytosine-5)-methyltransferase 1
MFAGVGGFRLALEGESRARAKTASWRIVWSNQWEPASKKQHASDCYVTHFGADGHSNEDIAVVLDEMKRGKRKVPKIDLLVGGFPCQDYSVARVLSQAAGLEGKKGVLWWEIHRFLEIARPKFIFLENVDRLLKSPARQRGRDFAIMLHGLAKLGYLVEWRVVNAADYGFPQRRRRTFIVGQLWTRKRAPFNDAIAWLVKDGVLARALPADLSVRGSQLPLGFGMTTPSFELPEDLLSLSETFSAEFQNAGIMHDRRVWTARLDSRFSGQRRVLADVLLDEADVPNEYFIPRQQLGDWRYLKGAKREERTVARNGFKYFYTEGRVQFPDLPEEASRTILTGEGGSAPSRFKHVVKTPSGRYRRLTPIELERLNGFPVGWTDTGMPDTRRAFCMGNALVVGLVKLVGDELALRRARVSSQAVRKAV